MFIKKNHTLNQRLGDVAQQYNTCLHMWGPYFDPWQHKSNTLIQNKFEYNEHPHAKKSGEGVDF